MNHILTDQVIGAEVARLAAKAGVQRDAYQFDAGYDIQTDSLALRMLSRDRIKYAAVSVSAKDRRLDLEQFSDEFCAPLVAKWVGRAELATDAKS